jgi:hypothetical protein
MVPSHRGVGFADADPALNPLASEALSFKEPALSFRYMDGPCSKKVLLTTLGSE